MSEELGVGIGTFKTHMNNVPDNVDGYQNSTGFDLTLHDVAKTRSTPQGSPAEPGKALGEALGEERRLSTEIHHSTSKLR